MALIGWENAVEAPGAALTASSEAVGYPVHLLAVPQGAPSVAWQTVAGVTSAHVQIAASMPGLRAVALARTNLTSAATIRVRAGAVATITSAPAYDSGIVLAGVGRGIGQALHILPSAVNVVACRIDIADPTNPEGCLNIPLAYVGPLRDVPISPSARRQVRGRADNAETRGGQVYDQFLSRARAWTFEAATIDDATAAWIDDLEAAAVAMRNILFVPRNDHPRAARDAVLGMLTPEALGFLTATGRNLTWSATIIERL